MKRKRKLSKTYLILFIAFCAVLFFAMKNQPWFRLDAAQVTIASTATGEREFSSLRPIILKKEKIYPAFSEHPVPLHPSGSLTEETDERNPNGEAKNKSGDSGLGTNWLCFR
ncbi:hypothetical protein MUB24_08620 [Lederbergia sp. NSJ-179]|uniref:hypothetical protein n=1 Tax=Lederbergia sp. NSJ-179 TaxID=2931402 RepID=UPI001FD1387D|nr:hypothetical protein [Lederbergia sp. NSJ-179]MCJ7840963.1 hypothetical protein [Lederbergia sp. NSJ-179]